MKRLLPVLSLLSVSFFAQAGPAPAAPPSPGHKPVTTFTDPRLLVEWDRDASGPFSLAAVFRILHETNGLSTPKAAIAATDAGGTATSTSGSGRDAGSSRDLGTDGEFTSTWSGALAKRMREVATSRGPGNTSADATRPVDYRAADAAASDSPGVTTIVAAASPPPASDGLRVAPVERAYLRAYWAENGARP